MLSRKIINTITVLLASLLICPTINSAQINANLLSEIAADPNQLHFAFIAMKDQSRVTGLAASLQLDSYTRQARHAIGIRHLKHKASETQRELLEFLEAKITSGEVKHYKSHWIDNIVSVEASGDILREISRRGDVEAIHQIGPARLIEPVEFSTGGASPSDTVESSLRVIGADSMWALGYTGAGRLLCSFDTGVDGAHPALSDSWRGNNGNSWQESWFDPADGDSVPHVIASSSNPQHGTHTLGTMVGHDDATGDTVGVAPDAQWIAAAVIDVPNGNILDAFEWAADPDGNPNTITDVPDAVANSWGYPQSVLGCEDVFWNAIDHLEALGVVVIFACGNEGNEGSMTIRNPANRVSSVYNSFAVGMVDPTIAGFPVHSRSSQGPSDCDEVSLKPQVVAPGVSIRSTIPVVNGSYGWSTGTSMACPHVAGAVALLREYNPNAPVDSIKKALMETAIDVEESGPDMKSGHGMIYIPSALEVLTPNATPYIFIAEITESSPDPGDTLDIEITFGNSGLGLADVIATLRSDDEHITLLDSFYVFGNIPQDGTADNSASPYRIVVSESAVQAEELTFTLAVSGSGGYSDDIPLVFVVREDPPTVRSTFIHDVGNVMFGLSNYGQYGFADSSIIEFGLPGFVWPYDGSGNNNLYEMALLIASDATHVSDAARNRIRVPDNDFEVATGGNVVFIEDGTYADQESFCLFDDSKAENPIGIMIHQHSLACADDTNDDYILLILRITNTTAQTIENLHIGILSDWDWPWGNPYTAGDDDRVGFNSDSDIGYMFSADSVENPDYRGVAVLNALGATSFRALKNNDYLYDGDGGTDAEKWDFMTGGINPSSSYLEYPDHANLIATGPFTLTTDDTVEVAFAVIGSNSLNDLIASAAQAKTKYEGVSADADSDDVEDQLPVHFTLYQNHPNPFNPATIIEFYLDRSEHVQLTIYNLLGQNVETLLDKHLDLGMHKVRWTASGLASGIYFYRLQTESRSEVRKMVLTK
jgi:subtilisin family serine protease